MKKFMTIIVIVTLFFILVACQEKTQETIIYQVTQNERSLDHWLITIEADIEFANKTNQTDFVISVLTDLVKDDVETIGSNSYEITVTLADEHYLFTYNKEALGLYLVE